MLDRKTGEEKDLDFQNKEGILLFNGGKEFHYDPRIMITLSMAISGIIDGPSDDTEGPIDIIFKTIHKNEESKRSMHALQSHRVINFEFDYLGRYSYLGTPIELRESHFKFSGGSNKNGKGEEGDEEGKSPKKEVNKYSDLESSSINL